MTSLLEALPLVRGPTNRLQFLLTQYMTETDVWMRQIFNSAQYAYNKDDLASIQRPSIFITPQTDEMRSNAFSIKGWITMELHFSFKEVRTSLAQNVIQIADDILLTNLDQKYETYLRANMYGLVAFGRDVKRDLTKVYDKESIVKIMFSWHVDAQAYQNELYKEGYSMTSPDEMIYGPAEKLLIELAVLNSDQTVAFVTE